MGKKGRAPSYDWLGDMSTAMGRLDNRSQGSWGSGSSQEQGGGYRYHTVPPNLTLFFPHTFPFLAANCRTDILYLY